MAPVNPTFAQPNVCLQTAFREWSPLCHLSDKGVHADDALEPPRVGVEQMREGLKDSALCGAHQRTIGLLEAFAAIAPNGCTRLQQREDRGRTSVVQGQIKRQIPALQ